MFLHSLNDPTFAAIRLKLEAHLVAYKNPYSVHSHFSSKIREYLTAVFKLYPEERIRQSLRDCAENACFVLVCHLERLCSVNQFVKYVK